MFTSRARFPVTWSRGLRVICSKPARQQLAKDWWEFEREKHELFTSQLVLDEIAFGDK